ncbi:MAG: CPBP family intramembrane metalloprotease [Hymenobacteraceae bacterium]|nr:CPBP family intramembrane metalloprotease [Hymenobacteraceae bacterium]
MLASVDPVPSLPGALPPALPDSWPPIARLAMLSGTCLLGVFAGLALAGGVIAVVWDVPLAGVAALLGGDAFHPHQRAIARTAQAVLHLAGFTLAPIVLLAFTLPTAAIGRWLRAQAHLPLPPMLAAVALTLVSLPLISAAIEWNAGWHFSGALTEFDQWMRAKEIAAQRLTTQIAQMDSVGELLACLLTLALVPAVGEELVFRGIVQPTLTRALGGRVHAGIWLTAVIFSAIHLQFLGFVPRLLLGAAFGYLYQWRGRLAVPIAAHFANNAAQVLLLYLSQRGALPGFDPDATTALPWPWVLASGGATAALLAWLHRGQMHAVAPAAAQPPPADA